MSDDKADLKEMCPKCGSTVKVWMQRSPDGNSKCECGFEGKHTEWLRPQKVLDRVNLLLTHSALDAANAKLAKTEAKLAKAVEGLRTAVEYLEPRLANKFGSRGLTVVLPNLRQTLTEIEGNDE